MKKIFLTLAEEKTPGFLLQKINLTQGNGFSQRIESIFLGFFDVHHQSSINAVKRTRYLQSSI